MMMTRTPPRWGENDDDPLGAATETPVDLAAVQGDDAVLDMLGGAEVARGDVDVDAELVTWRRAVDAEPIGSEPDTDEALAAIRAGRRRRVLSRLLRRLRWWLR